MSRISRISIIAIACGAVALAPSASADLGDQLAKLLPDDGAAGARFGYAVAISGEIAIVGAYHSGPGSAYLFDASTGQQLAKLLADNAGLEFGYSVAISGATAIVGEPSGAGAAYLFDVSDPQNVVQIAKLLADDGEAFDNFGWSVAVSGASGKEITIVGAHQDDDNGTNSGSAYVFDTTTGKQIAKLLPDDGAADEFFGRSVAISGTTAIVGAFHDDDNGVWSGSAYLFDTTTGKQIAKLLPDDGAADELFGTSVAISGTTAIVGAYLDADNNGVGSAYLFDTTTGQQVAKLLADDGEEDDRFGVSVGISGTIAIVGALLDDDHGSSSGSAYLFDTTTGQQIVKLLADDGAGSDWFGLAVAISGTNTTVGAYGDDDNGSESGSAYLFDVACACARPDECEPDCNGNGVFDACEIAAETSLDCNLNGIPDECEPFEDCNGNGVFDACDIAAGASRDCNGNGVPDECDIADGTSFDCNKNGIADECEAQDDCNGNGVQDICDIADGASFDCNQNNVPDECEGVIGDLNDDGVVDTTDLQLLLGNWGGCADCDDCYADIDCDCTVGTADLVILLGNWG